MHIQVVALEVIPYLMDIITPRVRVLSVQSMSQADQAQIHGDLFNVLFY